MKETKQMHSQYNHYAAYGSVVTKSEARLRIFTKSSINFSTNVMNVMKRLQTLMHQLMLGKADIKPGYRHLLVGDHTASLALPRLIPDAVQCSSPH